MTQLLHRVKSKLAIRAHRRVRGVLDGEYASVFHGKSLEFDELRPYVPGDEVKDIDWKATARYGVPFTKLYVAQRKHTVMLVVDTGRNLAALGADGRAKRDTAVLAAGIIGYLAHRHGDLVGLVCGDADGVHAVRAGGTESQLEQLLAHIDRRARADSGRSDLDRLLGYVTRRIRRRMILVVLSDDERISPERERLLRRLHAQHEILWLSIADADLMSGELAERDMIDVDDGRMLPEFIRRSATLRSEYRTATVEQTERTRDQLEALGVTGVRITGEDDAVPQIFRLLEKHNHARR
ncbi:Protein of unknown function DUF58 [Paramicrobacterium humi]|uniref:DUF58 domain-containing protein n=1 Tax=Paramicrobacterium humi TaxID=640635 RepID=A0A1H4PHZ9_9MICO|nr:DUF58 domain-containing protein [Microbacterium humi]SEC07009.1 Protein of unknown function DUF58 [Microbacterium humi]